MFESEGHWISAQLPNQNRISPSSMGRFEISEATLAFDRGEKASLYASAGILEYWIVNLVDHCLEVHRDPIHMTGQPYGYGYRSCSQYFANDAVAPLAISQSTLKVADLLL